MDLVVQSYGFVILILQSISERQLWCLYSGTSLNCFRTDRVGGDIVAKFETGISDFLTLLCISMITVSYSSAASLVELELFHCSAHGRKPGSEASPLYCRRTEREPSVTVL